MAESESNRSELLLKVMAVAALCVATHNSPALTFSAEVEVINEGTVPTKIELRNSEGGAIRSLELQPGQRTIVFYSYRPDSHVQWCQIEPKVADQQCGTVKLVPTAVASCTGVTCPPGGFSGDRTVIRLK